MSRLTSVREFAERPRSLGVVLALLLLGSSTGSAEASPIRKFSVASRATAGLAAWSSFLAGGPAAWASRNAPKITVGVRMAMAQALGSANARLSPWVQYLLWRQGLNPARFDRWHPQMVPWLNNLPPIPPPTPPPCPCPCTTCKPIKQQTHKPPKTTAPGGVIPPSTPEPNTLLISLALLGSGCLWRYHTGRRLVTATE